MSAPPGSKADALRKLKQRRASQEPHGGLPANHAARSHELNDQYMDNFDKAWQELYGEHAGDGPGSSADWATGEAVVGCSDHALYVVDLETGRRKRTLHTKQHGHAEWVTAVVHAAAGRIVSAGMDSKLCVWNAGSTRCTDLRAHSGSVSCLGVLPGSGLVASAGYDKTARLWDVAGARPRQACCLEGHAAPVTSLACCQALLVTGDRSGNLVAWDAAAAALAWQAKKAHNGHVTALTHSSPATGQAALVMSGGQDGVVRGWDARQGSCAFKREVHQNARGRGAVGDIIASGAPAADLLLTAGADATVRVLDPASGFRELYCIALPDFPYSLSAAGGLVFAGCGDGTVVVADVRSGAALYALGANQAAVRCLNVGADRLFTAGDDGTALLYSFL